MSRLLDHDRATFPERGMITEYMEWAVQTTHAPPLFHLHCVLPATALLLAKLGYTWESQHSPERFRLFSAFVANSGTGKSTVMTKTFDVLRDVLKATSSWYLDPLVQAAGSVPGIVHALRAHYDQNLGITTALLHSEEATSILRHDDMADTFNQLFDGRTYSRQLRHIQRDQKAGAAAHDEGVVYHPTVSAVFATTPSALEDVVRKAHLTGGLFSRILWFADTIRVHDFVPPIADPEEHRAEQRRLYAKRDELLQHWVWWVRALAQVLPVQTGGVRHVTLSREAAQVWEVELHQRYVSLLAGEQEQYLGFALRLGWYATQVAAIYALSQAKIVVDAPMMLRAVEYARRCEDVFFERLRPRLAVTEDYRLVQQVADIIRTAGPDGVKQRDIYRKLCVSKSTVEPALETLKAQERIACVVLPAGPHGGRPSTRWVWTSDSEEPQLPEATRH